MALNFLNVLPILWNHQKSPRFDDLSLAFMDEPFRLGGAQTLEALFPGKKHLFFVV